MRLFVAVPAPLSKSLQRVQARLRECGRPVRVIPGDQMHLTLSFLGDVELNQLPEITAALEQVVSRATSIEAQMQGLGVFPNLANPRVVWAGLEPVDPIRELADDLAGELEKAGFPREGRAFRPHVTVARVKGDAPDSLRIVLDENRKTDFGPLLIDSLVLYQSELGRGGPQYTSLSEHFFR